MSRWFGGRGMRRGTHRVPQARRASIGMFVVALLASGFAYVLADSQPAVGKPTGGGGGTTTSTATLAWNGKNGANLADQTGCDPTQGAYWHWILTSGGKATVVAATLTVNLQHSGSIVATGYRPGGGTNGAMHFDVNSSVPDKVVSASVTFDYTGTLGNVVLTISHAFCTDGTSSSASSSTASSSAASNSSNVLYPAASKARRAGAPTRCGRLRPTPTGSRWPLPPTSSRPSIGSSTTCRRTTC